MVLEFDVAERRVDMLKVTPGFLVVRVSIDVEPEGSGGSRAQVTYLYTALGPAGDAFIEAQTSGAYTAFMREWEHELNAYLRRRRSRSPS